VACDGAQAIRDVETHSYDLVLMDLSMPGVDGLDATRRIRRIPGAQSSVPIVALTASASSDVKSRCLAAGMNDYLSKPIEISALRRALDRWGYCRPFPIAPAPRRQDAAPETTEAVQPSLP
jgi:CheY-like chemotaxis protein